MSASVGVRTDEFLHAIRRRRLAITTPEGVRLQVELADPGERIAAFLIDVCLILGAIIVVVAVVGLVAGFTLRARVALALAGLVAFLVRTLYFTRFELVWQGSTPGKRAIGLRVIDRHGGPLLPGAVITRNLTREVETFLPLIALLSASAGGWGGIGLALWLLLLAAVPFANRNRLRAGDMLAGTVVIAVPKRVLLPDLLPDEKLFDFTDRQLRAYGAFELQVLEEVLRRPASRDTDKLYQDICARITRRIDWPDAVPQADAHRFLTQFYAAERAHLERENLFGRMKEAKDA
jgi:uncharacterized RDD family membrane protein YckC